MSFLHHVSEQKIKNKTQKKHKTQKHKNKTKIKPRKQETNAQNARPKNPKRKQVIYICPFCYWTHILFGQQVRFYLQIGSHNYRRLLKGRSYILSLNNSNNIYDNNINIYLPTSKLQYLIALLFLYFRCRTAV